MLNGNERPEVAQASVTFCACTSYGLISPMGAKRGYGGRTGAQKVMSEEFGAAQ